MAAAAVVLAATALSSAAHAEAPDQVRVRFKDLDTRTPAGAQQLLHRIRYAAEVVCGDPYSWDLGDRARRRHCQTDATARAVRQADIPMLTALAFRSAEPVELAGG